MILYTRLWETMKRKKVSQYKLINQYHMSGGQLDRLRIKDHHLSSATIDKLRHNKSITTTTLNDLCRILNCPIEAIVEYIPSDNDQML